MFPIGENPASAAEAGFSRRLPAGARSTRRARFEAMAIQSGTLQPIAFQCRCFRSERIPRLQQKRDSLVGFLLALGRHAEPDLRQWPFNRERYSPLLSSADVSRLRIGNVERAAERRRQFSSREATFNFGGLIWCQFRVTAISSVPLAVVPIRLLITPPQIGESVICWVLVTMAPLRYRGRRRTDKGFKNETMHE